MQYLDGAWLLQEGFQVAYATELYDWTWTCNEEGRRTLILYEPFRPIPHEGATLDGGLLTTEITSPAPGIFHFEQYHHLGVWRERPLFELKQQDDPLQLEVTEEKLTLKSGEASLEIARQGALIWSFYDGDQLKNRVLPRSRAWVQDDEGESWQSCRVALGVDEQIYGLGEHFGHFVKNGQSLDIWNRDGGTGTQQAYKNVPFYLSSKAYGVFVQDPGQVEFEIASERVSDVQFAVRGEVLRWCWLNGQDMAHVLERYTDLTGRAPRLPAWSYGLWLSTSFLTDYNEKTVLDFVDGCLERKIPLDVFHFDCLWMKAYEWCNFIWDEKKFPDPERLLAELHRRGLKVCVWINPYIAQKSPLFKEGLKEGYFLQKVDGSVWQWDRWQAGMAIVDFTNPAAAQWYKKQLSRLLDMGVDCFKTDFGERIPCDVFYWDDADPERMHNYYSKLYNQTVFELLLERKGEGEAVLFARSATAGCQAYPVHWGGDCTATYESMAESLRAGLSFALSGFAYWSHDIGGFEDGCEPELYRRWTQFGLLSSHSRYHGNGMNKVPWLYGEDSVENTRLYARLKQRLLPYLLCCQEEACQKGLPVMRPMVLAFPKDLNTRYLATQYMLGPDLLVAPVFTEQGDVSVYLPEGGDWIQLSPKAEMIARHKGGQWLHYRAGAFEIPLFLRAGGMLPLAEEAFNADQTDLKRVSLLLGVTPEPNHRRTLSLPQANGEIIGTIAWTPKQAEDSEKACPELGVEGIELLAVAYGDELTV